MILLKVEICFHDNSQQMVINFAFIYFSSTFHFNHLTYIKNFNHILILAKSIFFNFIVTDLNRRAHHHLNTKVILLILTSFLKFLNLY